MKMDELSNDELQLLSENLDKYLLREYTSQAFDGVDNVNAVALSAHWRQFAELGLLALSLPEEAGGFGFDISSNAQVMSSMGKACVIEPFLETLVCATLINRLGNSEQKNRWLSRICSGESQFTLAHDESLDDMDGVDAIFTTAQPYDNGWVLNGEKPLVLAGGVVPHYLVSAHLGDSGSEIGRVALFIVDADAAGLERSVCKALDGGVIANLSLSAVKLDESRRLTIENLPEFFALAQDEAAALVCVESVALMSFVFEQTLDYVKTRSQFGKLLGSFQVLQHRLADMLVQLEECKALAALAIQSLSMGVTERRRYVSAAKVKCAQGAQYICQQGIHLHGGMGLTQELSISRYVRRLMTLSCTWGSETYHLNRITELRDIN